MASLPVNCVIHPAGRPISTPCLKVLRRPIESAQYASETFQRVLAAQGIPCSLSRAGNVWDNAVMERFFSTLKTERTARQHDATRYAARADVLDFIGRLYNPIRRHSTLGYISPMQFEQQVASPCVHETRDSSALTRHSLAWLTAPNHTTFGSVQGRAE
jgi:putative transposase